jgi:hypothetical protein
MSPQPNAGDTAKQWCKVINRGKSLQLRQQACSQIITSAHPRSASFEDADFNDHCHSSDCGSFLRALQASVAPWTRWQRVATKRGIIRYLISMVSRMFSCSEMLLQPVERMAMVESQRLRAVN